MLWIVLVLWLLLGGGVLLLALSGGPAALGRRVVGDGALTKRLRVVGLIVAAAFGIAVPIAVAVDNGQDKAREGPGGITLTKDETVGRQLFSQTCATCHTLAAAAAVGHVGPDLGVLLPHESLVLYAIKNGFAQGRGQMPAGTYSGPQAADVAKFVAAVAGGGSGVSASTPAPTSGAPSPPAATTPVALGRQLYTADSCSSCHTLDGTPSVGPSWKGLYGSRVTLTTGGTITANAQYLTTHIVNPDEYTVKGFPKGEMAAAIAGDHLQSTPQDVSALVAFIKSLQH